MIRLLPPEVADAIAAGEVVERPASVVKELVENSLDAGARRVAVEIRGAGRALIRVADDGGGVAPGELRLAFTRHATSKLRSIADLDAIGSLGFRGEALASIAAVADVTARSGGARLRVRAGEVVEEGVDAPLEGTVVEVRELFHATPARLKFLKSEATETAAAVRALSAYALLYPGVRFQATVDGRQVLSTAGDGDLGRALAAVHGSRSAAEMRLIEAETVRGAVSEPRLSRGNRDGILLAVNSRPVASRSLGFALEECYQGLLERGRHPLAVIDVAVDPESIDVNVHPAKREVRFRAEGAVFDAVSRAVRAALQGSRPYAISVTAPSGRPASPQPALVRAAELALSAAPATAPTAVAVPGILRPLGQVMDGYLVAEGPDGLVLVDQHAAHERILYNRFLGRLQAGGGPSQPLLLPEVIELDPRQAATAADRRDQLQGLGFDLEDFGPRAVRVLAAPAETPPGRLQQAITELLDELGGSGSGRLEKAAASLACHSAVRFGDSLDVSEQRRLLDQLEAEPDAITCPHGRPTRLLLDWQELKRHFRRNY